MPLKAKNIIHSPGYCALYGTGGKVGFADLPRPNNIPAKKLSAEDRDRLVQICGSEWLHKDLTCCNSQQINQLETNLARVKPLISSCPACQENFFQMFCHFTCSPDQSTFINVTQSHINPDTGLEVVDDLDFAIDGPEFAAGFYQSCKGIKFGATNGYAMDLVGGGAKNYTQFLKFLGDKKPMLGGSPFQINFRYDSDISFQHIVRNCNDSNPAFKCACTDCTESCPILPHMKHQESCKIGSVPCLSISVLLIYAIVLAIYWCVIRAIRGNRKDLLYELFCQENHDLQLSDSDSDAETSIQPSYENGNTLPKAASYPLNNWMEKKFYSFGSMCASFPWRTIMISLFIAFTMGSFSKMLQLEQDPIHLWVSSNSEAFKQKEIFDTSFGPFYRTEQIFVSNTTDESIFQDYDFIKWWFIKESELKQTFTKSNTSYSEVCFKPTDDTCALESFSQYFHGDIRYLPQPTWKRRLAQCAKSPVSCLPSFQQPLSPDLLFGGDYNENGDVTNSSAFVVTFVVDNNESNIEILTKWESELESYIQTKLIPEATKWGINISFSTESSVKKELNRSTNTDIRIILISYLAMFAYVSLALSSGRGFKKAYDCYGNRGMPLKGLLYAFTKTRIGLGLIGVVIVLLSVWSSVGLCSLLGFKSTLIIAEVIPFLILAIGVDNVFLLCHELEHIESCDTANSMSLTEKIAKTLANIGPSILLSALSELFCFLLASLVSMPAVRNFAIYSAFSIIFNTLLQLTAFVAVLTLDEKRSSDGRLDILFWVTIEPNSPSLPDDSELDYVNSQTMLIDRSINSDEDLLTRFVSNWLAPTLFRKKVRKYVLWTFIIWFGISLSLFPKIQLGLDQRLAIPQDSHLINYYDDMYKYLNVGPPIYWVIGGANVSSIEGQQHICGRFTSCDSKSIVNILQQEYKRKNASTIAQPVASWLDDFLLWLNPDLSSCCRIKKSFLSSISNSDKFCSPTEPSRLCQPCYESKKWNFKMDGFPEGDTFYTYFNEWIKSPSSPCPLGGKAPYSTSIYKPNDTIIWSAFRNAHTPLHSQADFIKAYKSSLHITKEIQKEHPDINIFAYSPFYIFFVQYAHIIRLTALLVMTGLSFIFGLSRLLLGSVRNSLIVTLSAFSIMVDVIGSLGIMKVSLNAVSLVNLMICLGLAVEFSAHTARYFNFCPECTVNTSGQTLSGSMARAYNSLCFIGSTTLGGITMTKLIGICVLGFTRSKLFQIYYFRMWLSLILISSLHSLLFLPLILGYYGSKSPYQVSAYSATTNMEALS